MPCPSKAGAQQQQGQVVFLAKPGFVPGKASGCNALPSLSLCTSKVKALLVLGRC